MAGGVGERERGPEVTSLNLTRRPTRRLTRSLGLTGRLDPARSRRTDRCRDATGSRAATGYRQVPVLLALAVAGTVTACAGSPTEPEVARAAGSGTGPGTASVASDPQAQQRRWAACMTTAGVPMVRTSEGNYQVDKAKVGLAKIQSATQQCLPLQPAASPSRRPAAADLEQARRLSACLRGHGVPDYPDPDPATGQAPLTDAQARQLKSSASFRTAMEACRNSAGTPTGQLGG